MLRRVAPLAAFFILLSACSSGGGTPTSRGPAAESQLPSSLAATASPTGSPTAEPTPTPAPTAVPYTVMVRITDASGAPATKASVEATNFKVNNGWQARQIDPGTYVLNPGSGDPICIVVLPISTVDGPGPVSPQFTINASGSMVANSENSADNTGCSYSPTESPSEIDIQLPPFTLLQGVVLNSSGRSCGANRLVQATNHKLQGHAFTASDGTFSLYLTRATWGMISGNVGTLGKTVKVGAKPITGFKLQCPG